MYFSSDTSQPFYHQEIPNSGESWSVREAVRPPIQLPSINFNEMNKETDELPDLYLGDYFERKQEHIEPINGYQAQQNAGGPFPGVNHPQYNQGMPPMQHSMDGQHYSACTMHPSQEIVHGPPHNCHYDNREPFYQHQPNMYYPYHGFEDHNSQYPAFCLHYSYHQGYQKIPPTTVYAGGPPRHHPYSNGYYSLPTSKYHPIPHQNLPDSNDKQFEFECNRETAESALPSDSYKYSPPPSYRDLSFKTVSSSVPSTQPVTAPLTDDTIPAIHKSIVSKATGNVQIWKFLFQLLTDSKYSKFLHFTGSVDPHLEFILVDQDEVAKLWSVHRGRAICAAHMVRGMRGNYENKEKRDKKGLVKAGRIMHNKKNFTYSFITSCYPELEALANRPIDVIKNYARATPERIRKQYQISHP